MMPWMPKHCEVLWAREVLGRIGDGDTVVFPATESLALLYTVHHRQKTMTLDNTEELLDCEVLKAHIRGTLIFASAGYRVEEDALVTVALAIQAHRMDCISPTCPRESELLEVFFEGIAEQIERKRQQRERSGAN
jgi:hypothetical protein